MTTTDRMVRGIIDMHKQLGYQEPQRDAAGEWVFPEAEIYHDKDCPCLHSQRMTECRCQANIVLTYQGLIIVIDAEGRANIPSVN